MKKSWLILVSLIISGAFWQSCSKSDNNEITKPKEKEEQKDIENQWESRADSSTSFLMHSFWDDQVGYFYKSNTSHDFNYWPQAHGLDVLIDAYLRTQKNYYKDKIDLWFNGVKQKNGNSFLNHYYDDMEWNALAILRAYDATQDENFKVATQNIWTDIQTGWNNNEGGGISWNKTTLKYKNTPANAPAAILAARLYERFKKQADKDWALKIYGWLRDSLYDASSGFVYDGINRNGDGKRDNWAFTYNQGTMLGAALELYHVTKDPAFLTDATKIANNTLNSSSLTKEGLLSDEGQGDAGLFKGVFVRYFTQLILEPDLTDALRKRYIDFLKMNAETLWTTGTNKTMGLFGSSWKVPPSATTDLTTEESGAILMEAAALLHKKDLL